MELWGFLKQSWETRIRRVYPVLQLLEALAFVSKGDLRLLDDLFAASLHVLSGAASQYFGLWEIIVLGGGLLRLFLELSRCKDLRRWEEGGSPHAIVYKVHQVGVDATNAEVVVLHDDLLGYDVLVVGNDLLKVVRNLRGLL